MRRLPRAASPPLERGHIVLGEGVLNGSRTARVAIGRTQQLRGAGVILFGEHELAT
jgi:hypothetical protein